MKDKKLLKKIEEEIDYQINEMTEHNEYWSGWVDGLKTLREHIKSFKDEIEEERQAEIKKCRELFKKELDKKKESKTVITCPECKGKKSFHISSDGYENSKSWNCQACHGSGEMKKDLLFEIYYKKARDDLEMYLRDKDYLDRRVDETRIKIKKYKELLEK